MISFNTVNLNGNSQTSFKARQIHLPKIGTTSGKIPAPAPFKPVNPDAAFASLRTTIVKRNMAKAGVYPTATAPKAPNVNKDARV